MVYAGGWEDVVGFTLQLLVYAGGEECGIVLATSELEEELVVYAGGAEEVVGFTLELDEKLVVYAGGVE